jgi:RNA polymerase sigma-70 factor (ECF subfamily)
VSSPAKPAEEGGAELAAALERNLPALLAYIRLHAGPLVLAKESTADVAQSVCREVLEEMSGFEYRGEIPFRKWLCQVALNKIRERGRSLRAARRDVAREVPAPTGVDLGSLQPGFTTPSRIAIREEDMLAMERAFAQLPEDYRKVIVAARILGQSGAEIAAEMDRTEGAVRVLLHRALFRLGALMGTDGS